MPMWTADHRARQIVNGACALFNFNQLPASHEIIACVLFIIFNYACVSSDVSQSMFRQLMCKIDDMSDKDKDAPFGEHFSDEEDLSAVNESFLMSFAACVVDDYVALHAKLRRNISVLAPVKAGSTGMVRIDVSKRLRCWKFCFQ